MVGWDRDYRYLQAPPAYSPDGTLRAFFVWTGRTGGIVAFVERQDSGRTGSVEQTPFWFWQLWTSHAHLHAAILLYLLFYPSTYSTAVCPLSPNFLLSIHPPSSVVCLVCMTADMASRQVGKNGAAGVLHDTPVCLPCGDRAFFYAYLPLFSHNISISNSSMCLLLPCPQTVTLCAAPFPMLHFLLLLIYLPPV